MSLALLEQGHVIVAAATVVTVLLVVLLHYEVLSLLNRNLARLSRSPRPRVLVLILCLLVTHVAEIWIFAGSYWLLGMNGELGGLFVVNGPAISSFFDVVYFSSSVYTTLGFGDIVPFGHVRFLAGTESVTGFLLITWSASFTFLEMQRFWRN